MTTQTNESRLPTALARLVITDRDTASELLTTARIKPFSHLVSITDADYPIPCRGAENVDHVLCLGFDDVRRPCSVREAATVEQVTALVEFARTLRPDHRVLVHCEMGISRSTAAAYVVLAALYGPGAERDAFLDMRRMRWNARPNEYVVQLADHVLARDGRLVAELERYRLERLGRATR